jgi:CheY-like chemotaxis protein
VELCKSRKEIDIVLKDIKKPVMNGLLSTEHIKKERPDLAVIGQTAYAYLKEREDAINSGCNEYITKLIIKDELFELITKFI